MNPLATHLSALQFELAMAVSSSLELDVMLQTVAGVLLRRLDLRRVRIFRDLETSELVLSIPSRPAREREDLWTKRAELPGFGYLIMDRREPLPEQVLRALMPLNERIGRVARACLQHAELRFRELQFTNLAANLPEVLCDFSLDEKGRLSFLYVSPRAVDILELEPSEMCSSVDTFITRVHPEDVGALKDAWQHAAQTDGPLEQAIRIRTTNGERHLVFAGEKQPLNRERWSGFIQDVTARYRTMALEREANRLRTTLQLSKVHRHYNRRRQELLGLSLRLARTDSREELLRILGDHIPDLCIATRTTLYERLGDGSGRFTHISTDKPPPARWVSKTQPVAKVYETDLASSAIGACLRERRLISSHDSNDFDDWAVLRQQGFQHFVVVPLVDGEDILGTLNFCLANTPNQAHLEWLSQVGANIASHLVIIDTRAMLRDLAQDLELRVRERTRDLSEALEEKETLLREIHHRVKNNLQIISSLLMLQSREAPEATQPTLLTSANRVRSMALVHQQLYGVESLARIDIGSYARALATSLKASLAPAADLQITTEPVEVTIRTAVGLILNELLTNAIKYSQAGPIGLQIRAEANQISVAVQNVGQLPPGFDPFRQGGMGLQIVRSLVRPLRGTLSVSDTQQITFTLTCPTEQMGQSSQPVAQAEQVS